MAFRAGGGRRRQRFSAFMATFFPVSFLGFSNWKEKRRAGLLSPAAAVTEKEEEAGARRSALYLVSTLYIFLFYKFYNYLAVIF